MIFELKSKRAMNSDGKRVLDMYPMIEEDFFIRKIDHKSFIIIKGMKDIKTLIFITRKTVSVSMHYYNEHIQNMSFNGELTIND